MMSSKEVTKQLKEYFNGKRLTFSVPICFDKLDGTPFQKKVWREIKKIPYGKTISYAELARRAGFSKAYRAVGSACGRNPIPIIIPCHRVVASNGKIGGFSGELWRKKWLLEFEARNISRLDKRITARVK